MCGGGFYQDSIILVSGPTGSGKTLLTSHFVKGGERSDRGTLLLAFEESREQIIRNAKAWGFDYSAMEKAGKLKLVCEYPEISSLEDHLISIKSLITEMKPDRIAIDSLTALERVSTKKSFREFVIALASFIKNRNIAGFFTVSTPALIGAASITEAEVSTFTDSVILLRYVEMAGEMQRGITVLKMRGSDHDKYIRKYMVDHEGIHIDKPFSNAHGLLTGSPVPLDRP